jgi:hypothetical protein
MIVCVLMVVCGLVEVGRLKTALVEHLRHSVMVITCCAETTDESHKARNKKERILMKVSTDSRESASLSAEDRSLHMQLMPY